MNYFNINIFILFKFQLFSFEIPKTKKGGLTSRFGMGRCEHPQQNHQKR